MSKANALIAASILSADFSRLGEELRRAEDAGCDWHHVDVMDGHFVANLTIGLPVVKSLRAVTDRFLDVHLMVTDPWTHADSFMDAGASGISFHAEVLASGSAAELIGRIKARGKQACIAVNPQTPLDPLLPFLERLDMVLVMSVTPGFAGQAFMPQVLDKVRALRVEHGYQGLIQMDGGISRENILACAQAGCDVFVAGSALYGASDMKEELSQFRERIAGA